MTSRKQHISHKEAGSPGENAAPPLPLVRCAIGGLLMGLANLVPGVSGGTMILIMGLYEGFISALADATRLEFTRRSVIFLGVIALCAVAAIVSLAGPLASLVSLHPRAMYALFIGLTLGGVPLLWRMLRPVRGGEAAAVLAGVALMLAIGATMPEKTHLEEEEKARIAERIHQGEFTLERAHGLDVAAGVLGMSAMVLPGISGAYMLLLLGRYEQILAAISMTKDYVMSAGKSGDLSALHVLVPVAIGSLISLVAVTNILKWLLSHHQKPTIGVLLGIVTGSVVMLWPRINPQQLSHYVEAAALLAGGFLATLGLSRIGSRRSRSGT